MKILKIVESILLEATPEEIYNSHYKDISYDVFKQIVLSDPNTQRSGDEIKKIGKYGKLLLTMYKRKNLKIEDLPKATEYLTYVYKHQVSLDVNKIKNLVGLYDIVKKYYTKDAKDINTVLKALSPEEYKKVHQDDNWTIFVPLNEKAACYLGVNTEWCTAWGSQSLNPEYKDRESRYGFHNQKGPLYIIFNNSNLNEKYQFHFETNQYMDVNDKRINTGDFLSKNSGIKNFFFPSFTNPNLNNDLVEQQIDRVSVLSSSDLTKLINIVLDKVAETNQLIFNIINGNEISVNEQIQDKYLVSPVDLVDEKITFSIKKLIGDLESVENTLSYYKYDTYNSNERIYSDISNDDDEYKKQRLERLFKEYYEKNKNTLRSEFGVINYDQFKNEFFDNFSEDNGIEEKIYNTYASINSDAFELKCQELIDGIEKYISFSSYRQYYEIELKIGYFSLFLAKKNITSIKDNLEEVLDDYISYYNIQTEYEYVYDYQGRDVKYEDVKNDIQDYFERLLDDFEGTQECSKLRLKLSDIIQKLFKGGTTFENEHVMVQISNFKIDCEDGTINIIYFNKDTNKRFDGPVKVDNLTSYVTNYSLFESFVGFKRLI